MSSTIIHQIFYLLVALIFFISCQPSDPDENSQLVDTQICGGFLEFKATSNSLRKQLDYSKITVQTYTMDMVLKETTTLAASGYYFLPVYEDESFILKISGPYGMSFDPSQYIYNKNEGMQLKQFCSKDINFKFLGFAVSGKISTFGANEGPKDIQLGLFPSDSEQFIQKTITAEQGVFKFQPLYPNEDNKYYVIKPLENKEMFDPLYSEYKFNVNIKQENYFEKALIIKGYKLFGEIKTENGQPVDNAIISIYTKNSTLVKDYKCEHKYMDKKYEKDFKYNDMSPFCIITSNKEGKFAFSNIPYGQFTIIPVYKNEYISYSLSPKEIQINIQHENYEIPNPIRLKSFKLFGRVLNSKLQGIKNVQIKLDGQVKTTTDENGIYILENMVEGNYDLEATAESMFFEPLTNIRLHALLPSIPDVVVTFYKICGKILIEATDYFAINKRTVVLKDNGTKKERRTITDPNGQFCFEVKPGNYHVYPILTQEEKNSDLHLQPEMHELDVVDKPILDLFFYQSKVKISGKIICLNECESDIKVKLISTKTEKTQATSINQTDYSFEFTNILSGQYKLAIVKSNWCWEFEDLNVKVQNVDLQDLTFKQIGYSLFFSTQHDLELLYQNEGEEVKLNLDKNKEKVCLPKKGKYLFKPESCYLFKEQTFEYNTENSHLLLEFLPIEFRTKGVLKMDKSVLEDINVKEDISITLNIEEIDSENLVQKKEYKQMITKFNPENSYQIFEFYTKPNTKFVITPSINSANEKFKTILFIPKEKTITIRENCNENPDDLTFFIKNGLIIEGAVNPPMEGIKISAFSVLDNSLITYSYTNKEGTYSIGPMSNEERFELKAEKEGFKIVLSSINKNKYDFTAEKLSFLKVKVEDTEGRPLSGVFLSLSSADRSFKLNNNTNSEGYFNFIDLFKGEYYIQPLYKEYEFKNYQKLVNIEGGEHYNVTLVAKRVAFSLFGKVNNLNKNKVEGLYIQAINTKTNQIQETAIDKRGEYRLKGLIPGNDYNIKVKIPNFSNIEKALPTFIPIHVNKEDTTGVDFVVLQRSAKIDIRAYLKFSDGEKCPIEKIRNYYVELRRGDEEESKPISTIPVNGACQFVFRDLEPIKYYLTVIEKNTNIKNKIPDKKIIEHTVDLSDEREISNGVKYLHLDVNNSKKIIKDNLNYTIYSPMFLFLLIVSLLKWDYTVWIFKSFIIGPIDSLFSSFMNKKPKSVTNYRKKDKKNK